MVFQFNHMYLGDGEDKWNRNPLPLVEFKKVMTEWQSELYGKAWNSLFLENHDYPRSVSRFGNDSEEYREISAKMLGTCYQMMQGTPYIYQGEELGMTNYPFTKLEEFRDIECRNAYRELVEESHKREAQELISCFQFKCRDNSRTPMQWDDTENGGFTTGMPWIGVNPNYKTVNAREQVEREDSVFHYYQKLISLRKEYDIITEGNYELLLPESEEIYAYTRNWQEEKLLIVCSFSENDLRMEIPEEFLEGQILISNYDRTGVAQEMTLKPYEAFVIYRRK